MAGIGGAGADSTAGGNFVYWFVRLTPSLCDMVRMRRRFALFYRAAHISLPVAAHIWLIIDEVISNICRHARHPQAPLAMRLRRHQRWVEITFSDIANPFDPATIPDRLPNHRSHSLHNMPLGGQGLRLVRELAHRVDYCRQRQRNVLRVRYDLDRRRPRRC